MKNIARKKCAHTTRTHKQSTALKLQIMSELIALSWLNRVYISLAIKCYLFKVTDCVFVISFTIGRERMQKNLKKLNEIESKCAIHIPHSARDIMVMNFFYFHRLEKCFSMIIETIHYIKFCTFCAFHTQLICTWVFSNQQNIIFSFVFISELQIISNGPILRLCYWYPRFFALCVFVRLCAFVWQGLIFEASLWPQSKIHHSYLYYTLRVESFFLACLLYVDNYAKYSE